MKTTNYIATFRDHKRHIAEISKLPKATTHNRILKYQFNIKMPVNKKKKKNNFDR